MAHEWLRAPQALEYVSAGSIDAATMRICERAHSGLIVAKADVIYWQGQEERGRLIPKNFWWAEGHEALEQDWQAGDFSTWIDSKIEVKAFGVSFDFLTLSELVPADKQAQALRAVSVLSSEDWLSAHGLIRLMYDKHGPNKASAALMEACRLGQISGRAMRATGEGRQRTPGHRGGDWAALEWDIPLWFWRDFTDPEKSNCDWQLGTLKGRGVGPTGPDFIKLQGVHFHKSGLINLGLEPTAKDTEEPESKRGRKPSYDWPAASLAIFGLIYRGDLKPESQADIERALLVHLSRGDFSPSESTVRPYAKQIWDEYLKA